MVDYDVLDFMIAVENECKETTLESKVMNVKTVGLKGKSKGSLERHRIIYVWILASLMVVSKA